MVSAWGTASLGIHPYFVLWFLYLLLVTGPRHSLHRFDFFYFIQYHCPSCRMELTCFYCFVNANSKVGF